MPIPTPNGEAGAAGQVKHLKGPGSIVAAGELLARLEGMEGWSYRMTLVKIAFVTTVC